MNVPNLTRAERRAQLLKEQRETVKCDVCGDKAWKFIERLSTNNNRLLGERRYCEECIKVTGWTRVV